MDRPRAPSVPLTAGNGGALLVELLAMDPEGVSLAVRVCECSREAERDFGAAEEGRDRLRRDSVGGSDMLGTTNRRDEGWWPLVGGDGVEIFKQSAWLRSGKI